MASQIAHINQTERPI